MTGAIVVGNGKGVTGSGESISVQPFEPPASNVTPRRSPMPAGSRPASAVAIGLGGLALGAGSHSGRPPRRKAHDRLTGQAGTASPACCIASSKSWRLDTAWKAASVVIFPSWRRIRSDWSNVIIP